METVETIVDREPFSHLEVECTRARRERDFGVYQGHDGATFFKEFPKFAVLERGHEAKVAVPERGESYLAFRDRVSGAWERLLDSVRPSAANTIAVVTHSGAIRVVIAQIQGLDFSTVLRDRSVTNAGITECFIADEGPRVTALDQTDHLLSSNLTRGESL